jgi:hypothetical protein
LRGNGERRPFMNKAFAQSPFTTLARTLGAATVAASLAACGGSTANDSDVAASTPFVGAWSCNDTATLGGGQPQTTTSTLTITADTGEEITLVGSGSGTAACTVIATISNATAVAVAGQTCTLSGQSLAFASLTTRISGDTLTFDESATSTTSAGSSALTVAGVCNKQ